MSGKVDRPPDLVGDIRALRARVHELEQRVRSAAFLAPVLARVQVVGHSIPSATATFPSFNTVLADTAGAFNPVTPTLLTAPRPGLYAIAGQVSMGNNATGDRAIGFDSLTDTSINAVLRIPAPTTDLGLVTATLAEMGEGDTVRLFVHQTSGVDLGSGSVCRLSFAWLGPS